MAAVVAFALVPALIVLAIVLAALGASDAVVVGVIVGPLVVAGLGAVVLAIGAIAYLPYALWRDSRRRERSREAPRPYGDPPALRPRGESESRSTGLVRLGRIGRVRLRG